MDDKQRQEHLTKAAEHMRRAREQAEEARLWLFDLENVGDLRATAGEIKAAASVLEVQIKRQMRRERLIP